MSSETSNPSKKRQKVSLYDESWEQLPEFRDWLEKSENEDNARCRYCNKNIPIYLAGMEALRRHAQTRFHHSNVPVFYGPKPLDECVQEARELLEPIAKKYKWNARTKIHFVQAMASALPDSEIAQKLAADMSLVDIDDSDDSNDSD